MDKKYKNLTALRRPTQAVVKRVQEELEED